MDDPQVQYSCYLFYTKEIVNSIYFGSIKTSWSGGIKHFFVKNPT